MPRLKIFGRIFLFLRTNRKHDVRDGHAERNRENEADGIDADVLELRRTTRHEGLVDLIETGIEQRDDEGKAAADDGSDFGNGLDGQRGGEQEARAAEQKIEEDVRELADGEAEEDGHVGRRHPGRDLDAKDPKQPLPYAVAHPRRRLPLLPRKQEDPDHDCQHGEDGKRTNILFRFIHFTHEFN